MWIWWRLDPSLAPLHYHRIRCVRSRCTCQRRWWPAALEVVATLKEAAVDFLMAVGSVVVEVAWAALMLVVEMCERAFDAIEQAMRGRAARSTARRIACFRGRAVGNSSTWHLASSHREHFTSLTLVGTRCFVPNQPTTLISSILCLCRVILLASPPHLGGLLLSLSQDHNLWCSLSHLHSL